MNTMEDLKGVVAQQIDGTIGGHMFDLTKENLTVTQMIGVAEIDGDEEAYQTEGTILDPGHTFWTNWYDGRVTQFDTFELIEAAIYLLVQEQTVLITDVYGEESDLVYVEVDHTPESRVNTSVLCDTCGEPAGASVNFLPTSPNYMLQMTITCEHCGESGVYTSVMVKQ
jgi:hypothetical protein